MELTVNDLACTRGGVPVLSGVSFRLAPGDTLLLRGPNGIGKTTLLRTLAGLQPALAGRFAPGPEAFAYSAHADGVKSTLSVAENLRFWARVYGTGGIDAALATYDLRILAERPAQQLSAGQKRRLGLARLVVAGRPIWALDEPTVSLDAASQVLFEAAVARHCGTGGSALIATHADIAVGAESLDLTRFRADPAREGDAFLAEGAL